jgi:hypothetical protein
VAVRAAGGCSTTISSRVWVGDTGGRVPAALTTAPVEVTGGAATGPAHALADTASANPRTTWNELAVVVPDMPAPPDPR